jgi:carbon-monoxide dehydrogenase medium subunit
VYPAAFEYFAPETVDEALELLARYGEDAKILAGGQSLLPVMKLRISTPRYLIDVNRIGTLTGHRQAGDRLVFGALCRHAEVAGSSLVRERLPLMSDAAHVTADVPVRNRGTLGGSLAHADPAGDLPAALLALDAQITMVGRGGARTVAVSEFFLDAYTTQLASDEVLTEVAVPLPPAPCGGAYAKFEKRAGGFAVASVGVQVELDARGRCRMAAVSMGALGPVPTLVREVGDLLQGQTVTAAVLDEGERLIRQQADPFEDTRGSVEYKRHLAGVLFRRAFAVAWDRARGLEVATLRL